MKVSGFTIIQKGNDHPTLESLRSLLPLCDELIVNIEEKDGPTWELVGRLAQDDPRFLIIESDWPARSIDPKQWAKTLAAQNNIALAHCSGDWCISLRTDEIIQERDHALVREAMEDHLENPKIEGLLFEYIHFFGSTDVIRHSRKIYRREVRVVKPSASPWSVEGARSFRNTYGRKLAVAATGAQIFHYESVRAKDSASKPKLSPVLPQKIWGLRPYRDEHPPIMSDWISTKGWSWDLGQSPLFWRWKDLGDLFLDLWEWVSGFRLFEFRGYRLNKKSRLRLWSAPLLGSPAKSPPRASLILATYEMPRHLSRVFAGLENQSTNNFEVIVCDDGSGADTRRVIDQFKNRVGIRVEHVWQENKGFRKSLLLNKGVRTSEGEVLVFLDGDCVPHPDFMLDHINQTESGRYLAGRRIELGEEFSRGVCSIDIRRRRLISPHFRLFLSVWRGDSKFFQRTLRVQSRWLRRLLKMERVDDLKGCNYSVLREDFYKINGYDEEYEGYGREDGDIEVRLKNIGLKIKSMKGLALQGHLWHPRRNFTPKNDRLMDEAEMLKRTRVERGLVQEGLPSSTGSTPSETPSRL